MLSNLTFGVEIECIMPAGAAAELGIQPGAYHRGTPITALPGWNAQRDSSIHPADGMMAVEVVSGILKGEAGIQSVIDTIAKLTAAGARVNASCGFHVHVGFATDTTADIAALRRLCCLTSRHEPGLYAITGTRSRETGIYCQSIKAAYKPASKSEAKSAWTRAVGYSHNRYFTLNLTNTLFLGRPTVEFRVFSGTLNATKAIAYIQVCLGLVEKARTTESATGWDAKPEAKGTRFAGKGAGEVAAMRLLEAVCWTNRTFKGKAYGILAGDRKEMTAEMIRLAKKYDAPTA